MRLACHWLLRTGKLQSKPPPEREPRWLLRLPIASFVSFTNKAVKVNAQKSFPEKKKISVSCFCQTSICCHGNLQNSEVSSRKLWVCILLAFGVTWCHSRVWITGPWLLLERNSLAFHTWTWKVSHHIGVGWLTTRVILTQTVRRRGCWAGRAAHGKGVQRGPEGGVVGVLPLQHWRQ